MPAPVARSFARFVFAIVALTFLLDACGPPPPAADTLPARFSDQEFRDMMNGFSEAGGFFPSDNFLSNESGYQSVIPDLVVTLKSGGVYIGVGPEQNFTYIAAFRPRIAFIVDIRRQNMLEHLFYKALFETSDDRSDFLSRLFARRKIESATAATPESLFRAYKSERPLSAFFEWNTHRILEYLENQRGLKLSADDRSALRDIARAFFESGPELRYTFKGASAESRRMPSYSDLMSESDDQLHNWSFLATEDQFRTIQRMQNDNLIVPLVGDFAGPKAIRSVARYVEEHGSLVRVFYTSNVEQYLFQSEEQWKHFYKNVATLPVDSTSIFLRYIPDALIYGKPRTTLTSTLDRTMSAYRGRGLQDYYDLIRLSR